MKTNAQAHKKETSNIQAEKQELSYAQAQKLETSKKTQLHKKMIGLNTWYTLNGVHNTN